MGAAGDATKADGVGRDSAEVCGNVKGVVDDKLLDTADDWDMAGKASALVVEQGVAEAGSA